MATDSTLVNSLLDYLRKRQDGSNELTQLHNTYSMDNTNLTPEDCKKLIRNVVQTCERKWPDEQRFKDDINEIDTNVC